MYIFVLCISVQYPSHDWIYVQTAAIVTHNRVSIPKEPQASREIRCDTCNTGQSIPLRSLSSKKEFITETRTRFLHLTSVQFSTCRSFKIIPQTISNVHPVDIKIRSPWVASALCVSFFRFSAPWGYRRDAVAWSAGLAPMETITIQRPRRKPWGAREPAYTLFRLPPVPFVLHCVSSCWHRFHDLLHLAPLRLPPRFNPFQRGRALHQWSHVSGIFSHLNAS